MAVVAEHTLTVAIDAEFAEVLAPLEGSLTAQGSHIDALLRDALFNQGDAEASFVEHPIEIARRALMAAPEIETDGWPELLLRAARALPCRSPLAGAA